jgi:hypothetical protein
MVEKIMNFAFVEREYLDTKFVLVSWDVGRRGLWYGNEKFGKRSQFNTMEMTWPKGFGRVQCVITWNTISYDNVQGVGSKLYISNHCIQIGCAFVQFLLWAVLTSELKNTKASLYTIP